MTGEVLDALAKTSAAHTRAELRKAVSVFERASRSYVKAYAGTTGPCDEPPVISFTAGRSWAGAKTAPPRP